MTTKSRRIKKSEKEAHAKAWSHFLPIGKAISSAVFKSKSIVFRQGDPADSVYFIEDGKIRLTVVSKQGKEAVFAILGPNDFFGEGCLAGQSVRTSSASAMTTSTILKIEKSAMAQAILERPAVTKNFLEFLLSRKVQVEADMVYHLFNSSERRLARVLVLLADFGKGEARAVSIPRITQEILAARVGTTRTRINYFMNKFRKLGLIDYNGALKIHPSLLNMVLRE